MNGRPDTYGKVFDDTLPFILGDQKFGELGRETLRLLVDLSRDISVCVTNEEKVRAVAGYLLAAAGLARRVGRPIDGVYAITNAGHDALSRIAGRITNS